MSSGEDPRVHVTVDALDFLREEWSHLSDNIKAVSVPDRSRRLYFLDFPPIYATQAELRHVMSSGEEPRVHVTVDALDFLRDEWSHLSDKIKAVSALDPFKRFSP